MDIKTTAYPKRYAKMLRPKSDDGSLRDLEDLLKQIEDEASRLLSVHQRDEESTKHRIKEAELCRDIAKALKDNSSFQEAMRDPQVDMRYILLLGYVYGSLCAPSLHDERSGLRASLTLLKQQQGPLKRRRKQEAAREWMKQEAQQIWANDHAKELRIGAVADEVRKRVKKRKQEDDIAKNHWPDSLEVIRDAIRHVAPEYARKQGRPRKK
ncbi:hypothetical protein OCT51_11095 [Halomonas sp. LR3S48]|uniref:hypothetical protein n=1 Tax=Halomonas sp. LR3S48 TaxID=2982694 RepID=UPI0021E50B6D|nr:hypothetical protein [Halomonas sp. LR3S48]UYG01759.1 hypothetical protein OCT51_11095 [Halomonas sp. LR3S48]